jgi:hypothetical protein
MDGTEDHYVKGHKPMLSVIYGIWIHKYKQTNQQKVMNLNGGPWEGGSCGAKGTGTVMAGEQNQIQ